MKNDIGSLRTSHFYFVTAFFLLGLLMLLVSSSTKLFGIIILLGTLIYLAGILLFRFSHSGDERFKSNAREEILKHQHKR